MKQSLIRNTEQVKSIIAGRTTAFYELVKIKNGRVSYEANAASRTDLKAYGVLDKNGNFYVDDEHCPLTLESFVPYPLNTQIYIREAWMNMYDSGTKKLFPVAQSWFDDYSGFEWSSPATMPKSAACLWIEITGVKCMRVQDMTQEECKQLGIHAAPHRPSGGGCKAYADKNIFSDCYCCSFKTQFVKDNKMPFDTNPFIFLYTFKLVKK